MSINSSIPCVEINVKDNGTDLSTEKTIRKNVAIDVSFFLSFTFTKIFHTNIFYFQDD